MEFLIEYKVKPDKVHEVETARRKFFEGLRRDADPDVKYRALSKSEPGRFVHLGWYANQEALTRFQSTPHFKEFSSTMPELCEEGPTASPVTEVHSTDSSG